MPKENGILTTMMSDKDAFRHARELEERMRSKNEFPEWIEAGGGGEGGD